MGVCRTQSGLCRFLEANVVYDRPDGRAAGWREGCASPLPGFRAQEVYEGADGYWSSIEDPVLRDRFGKQLRERLADLQR